jgi:hypothetical protein
MSGDTVPIMLLIGAIWLLGVLLGMSLCKSAARGDQHRDQ